MPTVLVIGENRAILDEIGRALRTAGFSVAFASTGEDALKLAVEQSVDLVVADLRLPDWVGVDVLKQLQQTLLHAPVIVTGLDSTASGIDAGKLGAVAYVEKPVAADRLQVVSIYVENPAAQAAAPSELPRVSPQVLRTMHAIENRYIEPTLQVRTVAHDLGVSTEHLCRVLKRHTGLTFVALLRRTRVRAACRLLQTTTLSMKEIAGRAGFRSASRFNRDFKTVCGISPSEYRAGFWRHAVVG